jgi:TRAP-type mannitol/chloroaromatic compound transport system substrate-binding protein
VRPASIRALAEFNSNNALSLHKQRQEGRVKIQKFNDSVLKAMREISREVTAENGSGDEITRKIYASYQQFRNLITDWIGNTSRSCQVEVINAGIRRIAEQR